MELTVAYVAFDVAQMCCHKVYTIRVAHEHDLVGKVFRFQVQMVDAAIVIDEQLGR